MYSTTSQRTGRLVAAAAGAALVGSVAIAAAGPAQATEEEPEFAALVFSKTAGFRHGSIPVGIEAIEQLGEENNFTVDATEDAADFNDDNLANYDVVIWLSTTGDVLDSDQEAAFEGYIQDGGGYAGVHAASDTEYDWEWYGDLVGAYFNGHPQNQDADIWVEDHDHPSTAHLPDVWTRYDEWYNFDPNPRNDVHVLMSLDEDSYEGGTMDGDHPAAWCHDYDGGRAWYTAGGHTNESFAEPDFLQHMLGGFRTAAGVEGADCSPPDLDGFTDVDPDSTDFYDAIVWLAGQEITSGWPTEDGQEFRPFANITRDAMAAFLYRYADSPEVDTSGGSPFVDVDESLEHYEAILWLAGEDISDGWTTAEGAEFRPFEPITRDAMAAFLYRYADEPSWTDPEDSPFLDIEMDNTEFYTEITWLESTGVAEGWDVVGGVEFRPFNQTTRDAMAAFLYRFDQLDA